MYTPWGESDRTTKIAEGIIDCSTPSHSGIWLSGERQKQLPAGIKNYNGGLTWWEEDCDWVVPYILFREDIRAYGKAWEFEKNLATAYEIAKSYHPEMEIK